MTRKQIVFKKGDCTMALNMPDAMILLPLKETEKFCRDMNVFGNEEAFREFFSFIPLIKDDLYDEWDQASKDFQKNYQIPEGTRMEQKRIKSKNNRWYNKVYQAKSAYDRFEKKIPRLKELEAKYGNNN